MILRIDAHHHVWDLAARDQPWMTGAAMAPIARSFLMEEFLDVAETNGVGASVVVQTVTEVAETNELLDLAADTPRVAGVVGWVDVGAPDVGDRLDQLLARPSGSRLVGVRSMVEYEPDPAWLSRRAVLAGLGEVAVRGLVNELLVLPRQLGAVLEAVTAVPHGTFVIDHLAKPAIASSAWEPWAAELAAVARRQNVSAKISGLVSEADWRRWTAADVRPYVDHALAAFGPGRVMFGSDWPVCTLAASYRRVVELAEALTSGLSASEHAAVFGGNAIQTYSLDLSSLEAA